MSPGLLKGSVRRTCNRDLSNKPKMTSCVSAPFQLHDTPFEVTNTTLRFEGEAVTQDFGYRPQPTRAPQYCDSKLVHILDKDPRHIYIYVYVINNPNIHIHTHTHMYVSYVCVYIYISMLMSLFMILIGWGL